MNYIIVLQDSEYVIKETTESGFGVFNSKEDAEAGLVEIANVLDLSTLKATLARRALAPWGANKDKISKDNNESIKSSWRLKKK